MSAWDDSREKLVQLQKLRIAELETESVTLYAIIEELNSTVVDLRATIAGLREAARAVVEDWLSEPAGVEGRWEAINALAALLEKNDAE